MSDSEGVGSKTHPGTGVTTSEVPSFRAVYKQYFAFVWRCTRRLGIPLDAVDDVVQEVFLVVHMRLATLERPESLRSWIYGIVRRTVSSFHRSRSLRTARESIDPHAGDVAHALAPSPLDLAVSSDELRLMFRLLGEIAEPKREVLILAELDEMPVTEIAEAMNIPLNTAYSRLRIARQEFNEAFKRDAARRRARE